MVEAEAIFQWAEEKLEHESIDTFNMDCSLKSIDCVRKSGKLVYRNRAQELFAGGGI